MNLRQLVCIGASAGGIRTTVRLLEGLEPVPGRAYLLVQHVGADHDNQLVPVLKRHAPVDVVEATDKQVIAEGVLHVAPPNYHLLVERDHTLSLDAGDRVNYARPSIDVTFASAAESFCEATVGIILTGANRDGAMGMKRIFELGGTCIVQDPDEAPAGMMPRAALGEVPSREVLRIDEIAKWLNTHLPTGKGDER